MPGLGRAHRQTGRFFVANFTNDQHLRVLPEEMPDGLAERQAPILVDLGLHDTGDDLFGRILDGDDVPPAQFNKITKTSIDGRGLAAAHRPGEQQHPRIVP